MKKSTFRWMSLSSEQAAEKKWYQDAAVRRAGAFPVALSLGRERDLYFPLEAVHPNLPSQLEKEPLDKTLHLELLQLYRHLRFTTLLELEMVLPALKEIGLGTLPYPVSRKLQLEALRFITDEAFHGQRSEELISLLEEATGITSPHPSSLSPLLKNLSQKSALPNSLRHFLFCFVSETVITAIISKNARSVRHPAASTFFSEHLKDETAHSLFFRNVMAEIWPCLPKRTKRLAIEALIQDLQFFTRPHWEGLLEDLRLANLPGIKRGVKETLKNDPKTATFYWKDCARVTLSALKSLGVEIDLDNATGASSNDKLFK